MAKVSENSNFVLFNNSASENRMNIEVFNSKGDIIESVTYKMESREKSSDLPIPVYVFAAASIIIVFLIIFYFVKNK